MASLTGAPRTASPEPMVRSPDGSLNLRHPTPDLQSLQGAYVGNVERLERTAERMSTGGSELGEEIRKLQQEQKLADSRRSSIMSAPVDPAPTTRSRNASTSSYSNSIVDVNNAARWGGYSPGGFVTSPIGSVRSSSFSQPGVKRHASVSRSTRLDQVIQPELEEEDPAIVPAALNPVPRLASPKPPAHRDEPRSSQYQSDHDAQGTHHDYFATGIPEGQGVRQESQEYIAYNPSYHPQEERTVQPRPGSAASGDTYHQAKMLFHDFDGVHFSPIDEHSELQQEPRRSTLIHPPHRSPPQGVPAQRDSMVYYPAPVPRMLNLPKRLSQLPSATVQAKRRTQQLDNIPTDARKSALWLSGERPTSHDGGAVGPGSPGSAESPRRITAEAKRRTFQNNLNHLPPQLRASMFFDPQPPAQQVEVKGESAADTLDSILDASANAPVGAFTDHPIAGRVGAEVYGKDRSARRSTISGMEALGHDPRKSRSSLNLNGIFTRRESAGPGQMNKLQKRSSQLSLGAPLDLAKSEGELSPRQNEETDQGLANNEHPHEGPQSLEDKEQQQHQEGEEEDAAQRQEQQYFGPPTTLLAELQLRKQQQRTRNKAAATAFPNGMHATLLELDAVAEIEKKRRQGQRIALAWEDPAAIKAREEEEDEDADVPLGMLFPGRDGLLNKQFGHIANVGNAGNAGHLNRPPGDWDRPLGLYQKRELEDNEPLSRRRNRLKGVDPNRQPSPGKNINPTAPPPPPSEAPQEGTPKTEQEEEEEEGETLAQRIRRLKNEKALDSALEDVKVRPVSTMFASELLSQFEVDKDKDEKDKAKGEGETGIDKTGTPENEEETLGQRRARLQREALARGGQPQPQLGQMPLKQVRSMADLLAAHPAGLANNSRGITNEALVGSMPMGSLLQQNQLKEARHKREMFETNRRSSVFGLDKPLVDVSKNEKDWDTPLGLVGQSNKKKSYGSAAQMGIVGLHTQVPPQLPPQPQIQPQAQMGMGMSMMGGMQQMQIPVMAQNPMMAQQMGMWPQQGQMNMGMQMPMQGMNGYGMYQQPAMAMSGMSLGAMPMPVTYAAGAQMQMQMPMGLSQEALMDPRQRDLIDRWRQSIM